MVCVFAPFFSRFSNFISLLYTTRLTKIYPSRKEKEKSGELRCVPITSVTLMLRKLSGGSCDAPTASFVLPSFHAWKRTS